MKNPLTFRIESNVGALILLIVSSFFIFIFSSSYSVFIQELEIQSITQTQLLIPSRTERHLMIQWAHENHVEIPNDQSRYRHLVVKHPNRPWLENLH